MTIVFEDFDLPGGGTPPMAVEVTLWGAGRPIVGRSVLSGLYIGGTKRASIDINGAWQLDLVPNEDLVPEGTTYQIDHIFACEVVTTYIDVPVTGGPYSVQTIEVDAMNSVAPPVLSIHAADLDLHGGGIEVDYAEITSPIVVTGTALAAGTVTALAVTVPDLHRPVYITADVDITAIGPVVTGAVVLAPWDGVATTLNFLTWIDTNRRFPVTSATDDGPTLKLFKRLPPHTAGTYVVGAMNTASPFAVRVQGSIFGQSCIRAVTA